jgi:hypothetical protein
LVCCQQVHPDTAAAFQGCLKGSTVDPDGTSRHSHNLIPAHSEADHANETPGSSISCSPVPAPPSGKAGREVVKGHRSPVLTADQEEAQTMQVSPATCSSNCGVHKQDWEHLNALLVTNGFEALKFNSQHGYVPQRLFRRLACVSDTSGGSVQHPVCARFFHVVKVIS